MRCSTSRHSRCAAASGFAFVLQRRHDGRGRGLRPLAVSPVVAMLARSGVDSLLSRPLDAWIVALPPANKTAEAFRRRVLALCISARSKTS